MAQEHISHDSPFPTILGMGGRERIIDFLNRHGGAAPDVEHDLMRFGGEAGWSEVHAADGYRLRCDWSAFGDEQKMRFTELAPNGAGAAAQDPP